MKSLPFSGLRCDNSVQTKVKRRKQEDLNVWVSNLVTQQNDVVLTAASKSERIEKRLAKKKRTAETKHKLGNKKRKLPSALIAPASDENQEQLLKVAASAILHGRNAPRPPQQWRVQLTELSNNLELCLKIIKEKRKSWQKSYTPVPVLSNNTSKRRRQQLANQMENWFQPRRSNYGGIGLARPSLFIALDDPSWQAKLEEEFLEHVPGFYGKQRTKAMKKQLDGQMLWRQLQKQKLAKSSPKNPNLMLQIGKKFSNLNPNERVEALIRAGYV